MAFIVMVYIVMTSFVWQVMFVVIGGLYSYSPYSYDLHSHGLLCMAAHIVMAHIVMAFIVMAYTVIALCVWQVIAVVIGDL